MAADSSKWLAEKRDLLEVQGNVRFAVHIKPGKRTSEYLGVNDADELLVAVAAQPVENKANLALITYIAKLFSVAKSCVSIVSGATNRKKVLEVRTS